jgi:hypothetical protein
LYGEVQPKPEMSWDRHLENPLQWNQWKVGDAYDPSISQLRIADGFLGAGKDFL